MSAVVDERNAGARGERRVTLSVSAHRGGEVLSGPDEVVVEEPLEIRVVCGPADGRQLRTVTVTMRTPGHDHELALGFLFAEGLISRADEIRALAHCGPPPPGRPTSNIVRVELGEETIDLTRLARNFTSTSSCGICGKASLEALSLDGFEALSPGPRVRPEMLAELPGGLRCAQPIFASTGGVHAAGVFDERGTLGACREDIGRHNAVDKVIGSELLRGRREHLKSSILLVSGRVSFEIMEKALAASIPIVAAVGAPSSLAVEMAARFGMTLVGFVRDGGFNVYADAGRIGPHEKEQHTSPPLGGESRST